MAKIDLTRDMYEHSSTAATAAAAPNPTPGGSEGGTPMTGIDDIRERLAASDVRLSCLEGRTAAIQEAVEKLNRLLQGNGERGLLGAMELQRERIDVLQSQWRWMMGVLVALVLAVVQALLRR
jgi:hypothetical protein